MVIRVLVFWVLASAATAAIADCPKPNVKPSASGWQITHTVDEWIARSEEYPGLEVPLQMASPSKPEIYEFVVLPRYQGQIGLLQYYAGSPGTYKLITLIHNAILNLDALRVIGDAPVSEDCIAAEWTWFYDRVEIRSANGVSVISFQ